MEDQLKGLFGGGEAEPASAPTAAKPGGSGRRGGGGPRGGGGGRRRRQLSAAEVAQAEDFINRYTTGHPSEGFSSEEAVGYLRQLQGEVPPEVMQRAAVQTVRSLPEDQRKAFAEMLQRRQAGTGMVTIERTGEARATEGRGGAAASAGGGMDDMLGGLFGSLFGGQPEPQPHPQSRQAPQAPGGMDDMLGGLLGSLLGGGMAQPAPRGGTAQASDPFGDLLGGLLGGMGAPEPDPRARQQPPAQAQQQAQEQGGGIGDILGSPLGKAVLGGIAAYAMKEMMDKSRKG
jgi:hypothetical protein